MKFVEKEDTEKADKTERKVQGMTGEEAIEVIKDIYNYTKWDTYTTNEARTIAIQALEQEPKIRQFAKWVATEIFDDNWEYNKDAFAEIACRKLTKLGIVRANGDEWELVESQESEG